MIKYLDPKTDFAFKKIFRREKNKDLLIGLINSVLGSQLHRPIVDVSIVPTNLDPEIRTKKESYIDVLCHDQDGCQYIIEMQVSKEKGFEKRAQYYASKTFVQQMESGEKYHHLKQVIFLAFTDYILFPNKPHYKSKHITLDKKTQENDLNLISFTFVELPKFEKQRPQNITQLTLEQKFYYFLIHAENSEPNEVEQLIGNHPIIKRAFEELNLSSFTKQELQEYEAFQKYQRDSQMREDRIKQQGKKEGIELGKREGKKEGAKTREIQIAQGMLAKGMDTKLIQELTGLSTEEFNRLKAEL